MTVTKTIPASALGGLELHSGDTLRVLSVLDSTLVVQVHRSGSDEPLPRGKASEWVQSAKGAVSMHSGETVDDVRMSYYAEKYDLTP